MNEWLSVIFPFVSAWSIDRQVLDTIQRHPTDYRLDKFTPNESICSSAIISLHTADCFPQLIIHISALNPAFTTTFVLSESRVHLHSYLCSTELIRTTDYETLSGCSRFCTTIQFISCLMFSYE